MILVNGWFLAPSTANRCVKDPFVHHKDLKSLSIVMIGGEVFLRRLKSEFKEKILDGRIDVIASYGSTEVGMVTTTENMTSPGVSKANSTGYMCPGAEVKILDDAGNIVGPEFMGELWLRTPYMMTGYWGRPELNSQIFDDEGFFRSGDAGYFDSDGYLYACGRAADLITYRGTKISMAETEDVLRSHPAVLDAVVVDGPHPSGSRILVAFVVQKPESTITRDEINQYLQGQKEVQEVDDVHFIDEIPRTSTGKIQRSLLQEMLLTN